MVRRTRVPLPGRPTPRWSILLEPEADLSVGFELVVADSVVGIDLGNNGGGPVPCGEGATGAAEGRGSSIADALPLVLLAAYAFENPDDPLPEIELRRLGKLGP